MFVNIADVPVWRKGGHAVWNQIFDLNSTKIDENTYWHLIEIWSIMEDFFKQLLATLQGELNLVAQKFKIFVGEKRKKFELEHMGLSEHKVEQSTVCQYASEWFLHAIVDNYMEDDNSTLSSVRKVIPSGFKVSGFFHDVAEATTKEGSKRGLSLFKQRCNKYLSIIPENYIMSGIVGYVSEIIVRSEEVMKRKLDHIKIPELDLD